MARFQKTRIRAASAICFLLVLYCLGGMAYAAWHHSAEAIGTWAAIAVVAAIAGLLYHAHVLKKGRSTP